MSKIKIFIKKAEIKDASQIAQVQVSTWQYAYKNILPNNYLKRLSVREKAKRWQKTIEDKNKDTSILVAKNNRGKVLGFCVVGASRDKDTKPKTGELRAIYVDSKSMGKGIGSLLMKAGLDFLRKKYKLATLWVLTKNKNSIRFYKSKGWVNDNKKKRVIGKGVVFNETRYRIALGSHR